jgi:ketosteroid isomerase-like protein
MHATRPEQCGRIFADLLRQARLDDLVAMYEPAATVAMRDGEPITGRESIRNWLREVLRAGAIDLALDVVKIVESGELAVTHTDWRSTIRAQDGAVVESSGRALEVVRRQHDGRWLYVIDEPFGRE